METLTQIKDRVAQKHGYEKWLHLTFAMKDRTDGITTGKYLDIQDQAMQEYANTRCIRQRELCAEAYEDGDELNVPHFVILSSPLATEE